MMRAPPTLPPGAPEGVGLVEFGDSLSGPRCHAGFAAHAGPIARSGARGFGLALQPHHLNQAGRFHGGMVLTLLASACGEVAHDQARRAGAQMGAELLSLDCSFISAALGCVAVRAEVEMTRVTRTVAFLSARVLAADEVLATATAIFRIGAQPPPPADDASQAEDSPPDWSPMVTRDPFSRHMAPVYEQPSAAAPTRARFRVAAERVDAHGRGVLHEGMALFVADAFAGRAAAAACGARCVTLGMQVRRLSDAPAGSWVEFEPRVRHVMPSVVFVDGVFSVVGRPFMEVSSLWKVLGAA